MGEGGGAGGGNTRVARDVQKHGMQPLFIYLFINEIKEDMSIGRRSEKLLRGNIRRVAR